MFELHEARYKQQVIAQSAVNGLTATSPAVPANKYWTVLEACLFPSAAETRTVQWAILSGAVLLPVTIPVAIALSSTILFPLMTEGMQLTMWPGDQLRATRDVATAGSSMTIIVRYIESDLPYYSYVEPLNKVVRAAQQHGSTYRATGALSTGAPGSGIPGVGISGGEPGGRSGPEPI